MELSAEKVFDCGSDCEHEKKHDMMLDLSLSDQKSENLFAGSDQTPTPTRLIRNCDEVGLFEDLRHVNPFEETFRRACEQNSGQTSMQQLSSVEAHVDEDSLHTPQVYPQLEPIPSCEMHTKPLDSLSSATVLLDVPAVDELLHAAADAYKIGTSRQNSNTSTTSSGGYGKFYKFRAIAEKQAVVEVLSESLLPCIQLPTTTIQLVQPQLITLTFPDSSGNKSLGSSLETKPLGGLATTNAIPIQTVKPFIMPKLAPALTATTCTTTTSTNTTKVAKSTYVMPLTPLNTRTTSTITSSLTTNTTTSATTTAAASQSQLTAPQPAHEPSSASLTPTSQLPIKERLKAILSMGNKTHSAAPLQPVKSKSSRRVRCAPPGTGKYDEDSIVRRRAAATRYRIKMRNEHKELQHRNGELQAENEKLRTHIKRLEQDFAKSQQQQQLLSSVNGNLQSVPSQVQIPPSTLHLVMNIPAMVVPAGGQPSLVQPITYRVEKK